MHITYQRQRTRNAFVFQWGNTVVSFTITTVCYANKHDIGSGTRFCGVEVKCCQIHKTEGLKNYILKTLYK